MGYRRKQKKMTLENYVDFFLSHKQLRLTIQSLNQVIDMHGLRKIYRAPKKVVTDAVNTLDLMDPSRCTLNDNVSSLAFVALEDVIADLNELDWQECCVTSIQTLNSWKHSVPDSGTKQIPIKDSDRGGVSEGGDGASSSCVVGSEPGEQRGKSKRKRIKRSTVPDQSC
ncbi:uncharacterized protein LOC108981160 [Juglans regia]|uniref:Uncharacterized protein LOC108981160 n=1 Tax=Juglans regia TaxID=51240 RepID=A0A2I4DKW1_JUGRE|nr:uncharacterized protein LOC108981160 [Juglans regia]